MADPISGELVIVPDAEAIATIAGGDHYPWYDAIAFAEAYSDGVNSDYRLMTRAEALAIFNNAALVEQLTLDFSSGFWTVEEFDVSNAWRYSLAIEDLSYSNKASTHEAALPVRKVNFYGLPLIDSEYGGGLVYDVVAETRTVSIVANCNIFSINAYTWEDSMRTVPTEIGSEIFDSLPTRAQALKIFGNSYLVTLAGLPFYNDEYWTSESVGNGGAWCFIPIDLIASVEYVGLQFYALPVRSEVVPET